MRLVISHSCCRSVVLGKYDIAPESCNILDKYTASATAGRGRSCRKEQQVLEMLEPNDKCDLAQYFLSWRCTSTWLSYAHNCSDVAEGIIFPAIVQASSVQHDSPCVANLSHWVVEDGGKLRNETKSWSSTAKILTVLRSTLQGWRYQLHDGDRYVPLILKPSHESSSTMRPPFTQSMDTPDFQWPILKPHARTWWKWLYPMQLYTERSAYFFNSVIENPYL